ncbi:MAG: alpha/beta hydrolase [Paracoccaceae bacterium]
MDPLTRIVTIFAAVLLVVGGFAFLFGPSEPTGTDVRDFDRILPEYIDGYLQAAEAAFPDIIEGAEKRVVWADPATKERTELAVIYLHGFSATSEELRPVPDRVAAAVGANLYFVRFAGHGRGGEALAEPSMNDWINDLAEAMAIGRRIGDRILIVGTSTGGTLAAYAAMDGRINAGLAGVVLVSPNFGLRAAGSGFLNMPYAQRLLPYLAGDTRTWEPVSDAQGRWWTTKYPTVALLPMAALVKFTAGLRFGAARVPALFLVSDEDTVISVPAVRAVAGKWGGRSELVALELGPGDDPARHVLAGDILSPGQTDAVVERIVEWAGSL